MFASLARQWRFGITHCQELLLLLPGSDLLFPAVTSTPVVFAINLPSPFGLICIAILFSCAFLAGSLRKVKIPLRRKLRTARLVVAACLSHSLCCIARLCVMYVPGLFGCPGPFAWVLAPKPRCRSGVQWSGR